MVCTGFRPHFLCRNSGFQPVGVDIISKQSNIVLPEVEEEHNFMHCIALGEWNAQKNCTRAKLLDATQFDDELH